MFLEDFNCVADIIRDFEIEDTQMQATLYNANILIAWYTYENYSGDAYVLYEVDGTLYEVEGGHCSCYGLEGQWQPEATDVEALQYLVKNEAYRFRPFLKEVAGIIETLKNK